MRYAGIDPGKQGALALLSPGGKVIEVAPTPLRAIPGKSTGQYDLAEIKALLLRWSMESSGVTYGSGLHVTVELLQALPPRGFGKGGTGVGGSAANYARGVAQGWSWMLTGLGIPFQLTRPQTWQKVMHLGLEGLPDTKARSVEAARLLFPGQALLRTCRSKVPDDGIAEALLLAEFGRRCCEATARAV